MYKYGFLCYISILNSEVLRDQLVRKGLSIHSSLNLYMKPCSVRGPGLVGCAGRGQCTCSVSTPGPSTYFAPGPAQAWTLGPDRIQFPEGRGSTDLEFWHCDVRLFDPLIFLSYVVSISCLTVIPAVQFHLFRANDLDLLQNRP